jgi:hypothetical protein
MRTPAAQSAARQAAEAQAEQPAAMPAGPRRRPEEEARPGLEGLGTPIPK